MVVSDSQGETFIKYGHFNKEDILTLLMSLKNDKKSGILDSEKYLNFDGCKWRGVVDVSVLEEWLLCNSEEIQLHTLELLTISKKSTLPFNKCEFDLIIKFLKHNFIGKIEFVPLIKKVLKRLNDSYAVIRRELERINKLKNSAVPNTECPVTIKNIEIQQTNAHLNYHTFVKTLHRICLENLYDGAVNTRRKSSLQILSLMDEFLNEKLKNSLWNLDDFEKLFNCLLLDTYELNKQIAFHLIKSCKLVDLYFDDEEKLLELINVAMDLGNSIRPLDSITAACMLKIALLLPNVHKVLMNLTGLDLGYCSEEKETFYMVVLLKMYLEKQVKVASDNIVIASSKYSLYGYVYCIHNILSNIDLSNVNHNCWRELTLDLINMCFELNSAVSQIVNNSSPEGHLPMDLNPQYFECNNLEDTEDIIITPQIVLLCSWRTVKEISLFFGYLTSKASIFNEKTESGLLKEKQVKEIGNQLVTLLCETKHRGAFEQAHVGFGQLCSRLWHLSNDYVHLRQLPKIWLQQLLLAVIGLTPENSKLCATRRSAGVPFMVQALVTSEIKKRCDLNNLAFHSVMRIMFKFINIEDDFNLDDIDKLLFSESLFADCDKSEYFNYVDKVKIGCLKLNKITEIKTHALNILRALFRHNQLGELVKDYIANGFIIAFKCYDGQSWAEKNAATLLFSSLVIRVFGVQRTKDHLNLTLHNKMTGKMFFERFPSLLPFLLNELFIFVNEIECQNKPKVQLILSILLRLYPSVCVDISDDVWKMNQFIALISACGKSKIYKTRELAARALVSLLKESNVMPVCCELLNLMTNGKLPFNLMHGYALQLLEIVKSEQFLKIQIPQEHLTKFMNYLSSNILNNLEISNDIPACFPIAKAMIEILIELSNIESYSWFYSNPLFITILEKIDSHLKGKNVLKIRPGIELYEEAITILLINVLKNDNYNELLTVYQYLDSSFWKNLLCHKNVNVSTYAWSNIISVIQRFNSSVLHETGMDIAIAVVDQAFNLNLQDLMYEFIHSALTMNDIKNLQLYYTHEENRINLYSRMLIKLIEQIQHENFYPRGEFFKHFGRVFGYLLNCKNYELLYDHKVIFYEAFLKYSEMESNIDCRIRISEVLIDVYIDTIKTNNIYFILEWWTTLLQLLYDDNFQVRANAIKILNKLFLQKETYCEAIEVNIFFENFVSVVGSQNIEAVIIAFFCWSMISAEIVLEEMDETDVFNKSYNFECFEPLQIKTHCIRHLKKIISESKVNDISLSKEIINWSQNRLNIEDSFEFKTLKELIIKYKNLISETDKSLKRILDPVCQARKIKEIAYMEFQEIIVNKNDVILRN